jgi:hypothetical protein
MNGLSQLLREDDGGGLFRGALIFAQQPRPIDYLGEVKAVPGMSFQGCSSSNFQVQGLRTAATTATPHHHHHGGGGGEGGGADSLLVSPPLPAEKTSKKKRCLGETTNRGDDGAIITTTNTNDVSLAPSTKRQKVAGSQQQGECERPQGERDDRQRGD